MLVRLPGMAPTLTRVAPVLAVMAIACATDPATVADDSSSSSDGTSTTNSVPTGESGTEVTDPDADTSGSGSTATSSASTESSSEATTDASTGTTTTDATSSEGSSSESSSGESSSSEGSTTDTDADDGVWCGLTDAGTLVFENTGLSASPVHFFSDASKIGGSLAHAGWVDDDGSLLAASYDVQSGEWSEPVILEAGATPLLSAAGAEHAQGDALIGIPAYYIEGNPRMHHYDAATATWTPTTLPYALTYGHLTGLYIADDGDAIAAFTSYEPGSDNEISFLVHEYSAALGTWSDATILDTFVSQWWNQFVSAMDETTGAAAFMATTDAGDVGLHRLDPVTGEWTSAYGGAADVEVIAYGLDSLGDGRFLGVTIRQGAQHEVVVHEFDGEAWQAPLVIASADPPQFAYDAFSSARFTSTPDGRALIGWFLESNVLQVRSYTAGIGWADPQTVNADAQQDGDVFESALAVGLGDAGFAVAWNQSIEGAGVQAFSRMYEDGEGWSEIEEIDPEHPATTEQVYFIDPLSDTTTRALFRRMNEGANDQQLMYGCRSSGSGWAAPTVAEDWITRYVPRANGDLLLVTEDDGADTLSAHYFSASR